MLGAGCLLFFFSRLGCSTSCLGIALVSGGLCGTCAHMQDAHFETC